VKGPSVRRRQHGYVGLLLTCLGVMACLMLPRGLRQLAAVGYLALPLVLLRTLGLRIDEGTWPTLRMHVYRFLALVTWVTSLVWYLTPLSHRSTGVPLLLLWSLLVLWSCERLVRTLALERRINREAVLRWQGANANPASPVWAVDFVELNYFAFVTLTTTGYGDIHPVTPQTQMLCVMVAITGTVYLAMVMGVLISRYTARDVEDDIEN
jgi:voltage-gated potassium channel